MKVTNPERWNNAKKRMGGGALTGAALSVYGNVMQGSDPSWPIADQMEAAKHFSPSNPLLAAGVGAAVGLGYHVLKVHQEKKNQNLGRQFDGE